jgi:DNA-binding PadR family transcriptional regulator
MSTTRLLVLGAVRIFQPAHGYFVRRELLSWDIEKWANINPGSIYNALRTLTRDGYLVESEPADGGAGKQGRTAYRLTPDGHAEFLSLLRESLWQVDQWETSTLLGGLSFQPFLRRGEVIDAIEARASALRSIMSAGQHAVRGMQDSRSGPPHTVEHFLVSEQRWAGELAWCEQYLDRLRQGHYRFTPEPGWDDGPNRDGIWPGPLDKPAGPDS